MNQEINKRKKNSLRKWNASFLMAIWILILLVPSYLWVYNLDHHRLDLLDLDAKMGAGAWYGDIVDQMIPFYDGADIIGFATNKRDVYRFIDGKESRYVPQIPVGEDSKLILPLQDYYLIASQENGLKYKSVQVFEFWPASNEVVQVDEPRLVEGPLAENIIIYNDWIYHWYQSYEGDLYAVAINGEGRWEFPLGLKASKETQVGFNLTFPRIQNVPVLEVIKQDSIERESVYFVMDGKNQPLKVDEHPLAAINSSGQFERILEKPFYNNFWLTDDYLAAQSGERVDLYNQIDLNLDTSIETGIKDLHRVNVVDGELVTIPSKQASDAKEDIYQGYLKMSEEGEQELFQAEQGSLRERFNYYIKTPASVSLILTQVLILVLGIPLIGKMRKELS